MLANFKFTCDTWVGKLNYFEFDYFCLNNKKYCIKKIVYIFYLGP